MSWAETLNECWIILKNELSKEGIYSIEKFMNYIFVDLFPLLSTEECINNYDRFIEFVDKLELLIQEDFKNLKKKIENII